MLDGRMRGTCGRRMREPEARMERSVEPTPRVGCNTGAPSVGWAGIASACADAATAGVSPGDGDGSTRGAANRVGAPESWSS